MEAATAEENEEVHEAWPLRPNSSMSSHSLLTMCCLPPISMMQSVHVYCCFVQVNVKPRSPSVAVSSKWEIKAEIDFLQLAKLNFNPEESKEL